MNTQLILLGHGRARQALDRFCRLMETLMAGLLGAMVVMVFGNVVMRYVFNSGITVSEELSRWAFVWMTFLGAIVAVHERAHLGTDMLVSRLGNRGKRLCLLVGQTLMIYATWLLLTGSWEQMKINWSAEAPISGISMGYFYASGVIFSIASGVMLVLEFVRSVTGQQSDDELVMIQESEDLAQVEALHLDQREAFGKR